MYNIKGKNNSVEIIFNAELKKRSDRIMDYFLGCFYITGLLFACFYDTWVIAFGVGSCAILAYYFVKYMLPNSKLYQYVLSVVLGIFMAQFIFQMHGLFEMHFFAFIASAILITYQNWKLQLPLVLFVIIHHAALGYLQNIGVKGVFFTQLDVLELQTFIIHIILAAVIFFICALWAYQLNKYSKKQIEQMLEMGKLEKEAQLNIVRLANEQALKIAYDNAEKARQEADDANKAKSIFLATMSHEIRTPMNGVIGMASLLNETKLTDEQREYSKSISTCGEALLTVINDILDFSKIESGNMDLEQHDFNLRTCVEEVLDVFAEKAGKIGLDLVYEIEHDVPAQIIGDSFRLRQILMNLISNAIKFTESGEIFIKVYVLKYIGNKEIDIQFEIKDTGIGIPIEKKERLFKAFSQVDSSTTRKYGGTGLGLVICEKLIQLMNGHINVVSVEGKGTTFVFNIIAGISSQSTRTYITNNISGFEGKKLLVIDDNETNRIILNNQLLLWKLSPTIAVSAKDALYILSKNQQFDLILTDMQMPDMDGKQLAKKIKLLYPTLPIILLSSIGDENNKNTKNLFNAVLTKPIKQEQLCKLLIKQLRSKVEISEVNELVIPTLSTEFALQFPLNILIAEDNEINQKLALMILSKMGYNATLAINGVQAININNTTKFDLIFMDVQMPEMDGLTATKLIRKEAKFQPIIIAMTANAMEEDRIECLSAGMDDFLSKPVKLDEIKNMLIKWATTKTK
jgi:two-component system, sensor histidine kinase and response regulator